MAKQLEIPIYFLTLLRADLRQRELPYIINKLNNLGLGNKKISYQERCNLLNNNPVLAARHFQYKTFFKEIILDPHWANQICYSD